MEKRHTSSPNGSVRSGNNPMRLPFEPNSRRGGWADWIFRHRIGLLVTVVIYLLLAIMFVTYKIVIQPSPLATIEIDMSEEQIKQIEELIEQQKEIQQMEQATGGKMQNRVSDENSKYNTALRDSKNTEASKIYEEAQRVSEQVAAGRENYDRSLQEIENNRPKLLKPENASLSNKKVGGENRDAFVSGNVAVSFNLEGRTADYIDKPAYKCEGGGQVVVNIGVNRNGRVVSASVDRATSTTERCILDEAVASAKASRFSASSTALNPQYGTITFTFVPQ